MEEGLDIRRLLRFLGVAAAGMVVTLTGLAWDAALHARDHTLAAHEGVFTLANPYRVVVDVAHQPSQPFGTATVGRDGTAPDVIVTGVRSGAHPGYDRLVFDIAGSDPATWRARYLGGGTIEVLFTGNGSPTTSPHATHSGPATVPIGLTAIKSVSFTVIGAGLMTANVSTAARHGFRILVLTNPTRIVLDVAH